MDLTKLSTLMSFETTEDGHMVSVPYTLNTKTMEWDRLDNDTNYFLKDEK